MDDIHREGEEEARIEGHMAHPEHPLVYVAIGGEAFECDGCNQPGNGCRYQCFACDVVLHHHCATCPPTVSFASHNLNLVKNSHLRFGIRSCDVCAADVDGLIFYRCEERNFDAHPLCTRLPELIRHPSHPDHLLRLQPLSSGTCRLCKTLCTATSWGYRCHLSHFNLHLPCLSKSPQLDCLHFLKSPLLVLLVALLACMLILTMADRRYPRAYTVIRYSLGSEQTTFMLRQHIFD